MVGLIITVMSCSPSCSCVTTFRRNSPVRAVMSVSHWRTRDLELVVLFLSRSFHLDKMIFQMSLDVPIKQLVFKVSCYFIEFHQKGSTEWYGPLVMRGTAWIVPVWHCLGLWLSIPVPPVQWYSQGTAPSLAQIFLPESWDRKRKEIWDLSFQLSRHTFVSSVSWQIRKNKFGQTQKKKNRANL